MTRHDDDHRFRNDPRNDRADSRPPQSGSRLHGPGDGPSYGRGEYEHDDMSSGGVAGGARGYGYGDGYGPGHGGNGQPGRGSAGRYGSEHAGMGGGYGIGASGQEDHRGKGPKGYRRSDDRIREDVCDSLTDDPMLDAGEIDVQVRDGEVTLSGTVSDRLAKRHAEDMIERVTGVRDVQNNIRVKERDAAGR
ncbi:BON domain-containing protein [Reyranella sp.]|uniref:BON domain-containing protein n=1 Tax=Reyranella sp. TaxID=1929291 RepID=UPI003C7E5AD3